MLWNFCIVHVGTAVSEMIQGQEIQQIWLRWGLLIKLLFSEKLTRIIPQAIPGRPRVCYQKKITVLIYCFVFKKLSVGSVFNTCQIIFSRMNLYDLLCIATVIFEYFHGNGITKLLTIFSLMNCFMWFQIWPSWFLDFVLWAKKNL